MAVVVAAVHFVVCPWGCGAGVLRLVSCLACLMRRGQIPLLYESTKEIAASLDDAGEGLESGIGNGYKMWQVGEKVVSGSGIGVAGV
jgi:hypothetical protein